jgi:ferrous iron transport protein A
MAASYTLEKATVGETLCVKAILDDETATVAMRLGIAEGEIIYLASKVPGGPVIIRRGGMEIALGRELCRGIEVQRQEGSVR